MTESPRLVAVGITGATTTVYADVTVLGPATAVVLSADYELLDPEAPWFQGYPTRPFLTGANPPEYPGRVISSGETIELLLCEATALINANGATLA